MNQVSDTAAKPVMINCFTKEQINLLKDLIHYERVGREELEATMKIDYDWTDTGAATRKATLEHALTNEEATGCDAAEEPARRAGHVRRGRAEHPAGDAGQDVRGGHLKVRRERSALAMEDRPTLALGLCHI